MSVPHPGATRTRNLYAQLKRDVLDRVPQIRRVEYVPDDIEARQLRAIFDPNRLDPPTGPETPELTVRWFRQDPHDWFRIDYTDPNAGIHAGWHQDEAIPTWDERISSTRPARRRDTGEFRSNTRRRHLGNRRRTPR